MDFQTLILNVLNKFISKGQDTRGNNNGEEVHHNFWSLFMFLKEIKMLAFKLQIKLHFCYPVNCVLYVKTLFWDIGSVIYTYPHHPIHVLSNFVSGWIPNLNYWIIRVEGSNTTIRK